VSALKPDDFYLENIPILGLDLSYGIRKHKNQGNLFLLFFVGGGSRTALMSRADEIVVYPELGASMASFRQRVKGRADTQVRP
jgi:hypothetical protein